MEDRRRLRELREAERTLDDALAGVRHAEATATRAAGRLIAWIGAVPEAALAHARDNVRHEIRRERRRPRVS